MNETACLLELLERPDELPETIEEQLVGPNLLRLVRELETIQGTPGPALDLSSSELRGRILAEGLRGLSDEEFRSLLRQPRTLLQLQKAVLLEGKEYWDRVIRRAQAGNSPAIVRTPTAPSSPWYRSPWAWTANAVTGLAAAAAVFFALGPVSRQLSEETRRNEALQRDLLAMRAASPPVLPADLPEVQEHPAAAAKDPGDLPGNDPDDLPDVPKQARPDV